MPPPSFAPFDGPALKVLWARRRIDELVKLLSEYAARVQFVVGPDPYSPQNDKFDFYRLLPSERLPNNVSLLIGEIVHHLRSALDIMVCDIARTQGKERQFNFPFAVDADEFDFLMRQHSPPSEKDKRRSEVRKLGAFVVRLIRECAPFKTGGDPLLRGLHDLDNQDKHRLILPMIGAAGFMRPVISVGDWNVQMDMKMNIYEGQLWQVQKGEPFNFSFEKAEFVEPVFANPLPFGGESVVYVVSQMANLVDGIIERFEPHFWDRERGIPLTPNDPSIIL